MSTERNRSSEAVFPWAQDGDGNFYRIDDPLTSVPEGEPAPQRTAQLVACSLPKHAASEFAGYAALIHYPEHWDVAAYPTLESAVREALACSGCSACKDPDAYGVELRKAPAALTDEQVIAAARLASPGPVTQDQIAIYLPVWRAFLDAIAAVTAPAVIDVERAELLRLRALINTPHTDEWMRAVDLEAAHQQERWGSEHDAGKEAEDWFWLLGYLSGKALGAFKRGDHDKGLHHIVSSGAVLLNWHRNVTGVATGMRPGISALAASRSEQP